MISELFYFVIWLMYCLVLMAIVIVIVFLALFIVFYGLCKFFARILGYNVSWYKTLPEFTKIEKR